MTKDKASVSRRSFLAGMGLLGVTAGAGAGLVACSPSPANESSGSSQSSPEGAGRHSWDVAPAPIEDIVETIEADIVIVGAGMAGMNTAAAAAINGANVVVLERTEQYQVRGTDNAAVGSKFQIENGMDINRAELLKYATQWSHMKIDENLYKIWLYKSGEVFDELIDLLADNGAEVVAGVGSRGDLEDAEIFFRQYPTAHSWKPAGAAEASMNLEDGRPANSLIGDAVVKQAEENGARFIFNTCAEQLIQDDSGRVTGVVARGEDGKYRQYNAATAVVLCTGDIGGSEEMLEAFSPMTMRAGGVFYTPEGANDGLGHKMAIWCGAAFQHGPAAPMTHAVAGPGQVLSQQDIGWLMVNKYGKRFADETPNEVSISNALLMQPEAKAWSIFDSEYETKVISMLGSNRSNKGIIVDENTPQAIEEGIEQGGMWKADTLEDLANQLGIEDVDTFLATVERYNLLCEEGVDRDFGKSEQWMNSSILTPPFYATYVPAFTLTVQYGLNCNDQLQVCTEDDAPIEGLYAAGNACGNFFADDYPLLTPGISHGRAITFGRVLGEALAKNEKITIEEN